MPRQHRRVALAAAALLVTTMLGGCVDARPEQAQCVRAPGDVLHTIATNLTEPGGLRHGSLQLSDGLTFVTAELVREDDPERLRGRLVTWVSGSLDGGEFFAVDVYARDNSTWPPAPFDVRQTGAIESRACTAFRAGEPDPAMVLGGGSPDGGPDEVPSDVPDDEGDDEAPGPVIGF